MNAFYSESLWSMIKEQSSRAERKHFAIAYTASEDQLALQAGDVLVTDASDSTIMARSTCRDALRRLVDRDVEVRHCPSLHAKVYVFDDAAVIGSANSSPNSQNNLIEAGVLTHDQAVVDSARSFVLNLASRSQIVDSDMLDRLDRLKLSDKRPISKSEPRIAVGDGDVAMWLVYVSDLTSKAADDDQSRIDAGSGEAEKTLEYRDSVTNWMRCRKSGKLPQRARPGDMVVMLWAEDRGDPPEWAYFPCPIRLIQGEDDCNRVYYEEYADSEETCLPFEEFKSLLQNAGFKRTLGRFPCRTIPHKIATTLRKDWLSMIE